MRLVKSFEDSSKVGFCAFTPDRTISKREFIVVTDLDSEDRLFALRKRLVADYLEFVAETERDVSWADLDIEISSIMSAKFHTI
jgi:hypothetical protein